jgi:hypothetical protein
MSKLSTGQNEHIWLRKGVQFLKTLSASPEGPRFLQSVNLLQLKTEALFAACHPNYVAF